MSRGTAVAIALLSAALAAAGCGLGPGDRVGEVELTVTRDYGAATLVGPVREEVDEADTVMRVLDRSADLTTRFGGAFVQSIDGIDGERRDGSPYDWFYYVNGLWAPVGAGEFPLRGGEEIWWDYRNWSVGVRVSAVVGSWPQPFADGYEGERHPTEVRCLAAGVACAEVRRRLREVGASLAPSKAADAIVVVVGPWARLRDDGDAALLGDGAALSGVFAGFEPRGAGGYRLVGLDEEGEPARRFGPGAGLVAAMRRLEEPPVWIVTGAGSRGVSAAAKALAAEGLGDRYAVAVEAGREVPLPVR